MKEPIIGIIMGSASDWRVMEAAAKQLDAFDIAYEVKIVSAHRTPDLLMEYAGTAHQRGIKVIIAGAGGAAHLPGMTAAKSPLPVIGVPVKSSNSIDGWDSMLSILQMPTGVPVATVALDGAANAAILAAQIIGCHDLTVQQKLIAFKKEMQEKVLHAELDKSRIRFNQ